MASPWQFIPDEILEQETRRKQAEDWILGQRKRLAEDWLNQRLNDLNETMSNFLGQVGETLNEPTPNVPRSLSEANADYISRSESAAQQATEISDWNRENLVAPQMGVLAGPLISQPGEEPETFEQGKEAWKKVPESFAKSAAEFIAPSEIALNLVDPGHIYRAEKLVGKVAGKTIPKLGEAAQGVGRAVAERALEATPMRTMAGKGLGEAIPEVSTKRYYHGTGSAFDKFDPDKFDPNGLYGPALYITDSPIVSGGYTTITRAPQLAKLTAAERKLQEQEQLLTDWISDSTRGFINRNISELKAEIEALERSLGPNIRPIDVPEGLKLFDVEAPLDNKALQDLWRAIPANDQPMLFAALERQIETGRQLTNQDVYQELGIALQGGRVGNEGLQSANAVLQSAGYDGIRYQGGKRVPMKDAAGNPIEHEVLAIFPKSLSKIRNAITGTEGGQIPVGPAIDIGVGSASGATGYDPEASWEENALNVGTRFIGGAATSHVIRGGPLKESLTPGLATKQIPSMGQQWIKVSGVNQRPPRKPPKPPDIGDYKGPMRTPKLKQVWNRTRNILEGMGEEGKTLGRDLHQWRENWQPVASEWMKVQPTVRSLRGKDVQDFWDIMEGVPLPKPSLKVLKAVGEAKPIREEIWDEAMKAKISMGKEADYMPREADLNFTANEWKDQIKKLIESGKTEDEAVRMIRYSERDVNRAYGHFKPRSKDENLDYKKSLDVWFRYVQQSAKYIERYKLFGKDDAKAMDLISAMGPKGFNKKVAKDLFDTAIGRYYPQDSPDVIVSQFARGANVLTKLGLGAISNAQQPINTATVAGVIKTAIGGAKAFTPEGRAFVEKTGVLSDAILKDLREGAGFGGEVGKNLAAPLFNPVEKWNRSLTALAGREMAPDISKGAWKLDGKVLEHLQKIGIDAMDIANKRRLLTEDEQIKVARDLVERTQFYVDPQDLPPWASTPIGRMVVQFGTFEYNQAAFMGREVIIPAIKAATGRPGGDLRPLARWLVLAPIIGAAKTETLNTITGRERDENEGRNVLEYYMAPGTFPIIARIIKGADPLNSKYVDPEIIASRTAGSLLGPTFSTISEGVGASVAAAKGKPEPLGRLALRQLPIVGSSVQNRVLPYKQKKTPSQPGRTVRGTEPNPGRTYLKDRR